MKYIKRYEKLYSIDDLIENIQNLNMVKKILSSGIDPNSYGKTYYPVIHLAAYYDNIEVFDILLKYGAKIDGINTSNGNTTLIDFSFYSSLNKLYDIDMLCHIIDKGADWSIVNFDGKDFMDALYYNNSIHPKLQYSEKDNIINDIIKKYPEKYKEYLIKKDSNKYNI